MATLNNQGIIFSPSYGTFSRPGSPTAGQVIFNTDTNTLEVYTSRNTWEVVARDTAFYYRTIISTSYVAAGYKDTVPWRNVNRMVHATDACTNLGDLLQEPGAYVSGFNNKDSAFVWGCVNSWPGVSSYTSSFNMRNETTKAHSTNHNMTVARDDSGTAFKEHEFAYILAGGSTTIDVFNGSSETMITNSVSRPTLGTAGGTQSAVGVMSDEAHALIGDDTTGYNALLYFPTVTQLALTTNRLRSTGNVLRNLTSDGQQKAIQSKLRLGWIGNQGTYNGKYEYRKWNLSTFTWISTMASIDVNFGEENYDMGQAHQYMMGNYNGAQNNNGHKFYYATDSGVMLGTGSVRTGVPGSSSGACSWRD